MIRHLSILLAAGIIVALPFALRQPDAHSDWQPGDPQLAIVSPHNEAIRYEFARAFSDWHRQQFGRPVKIDWLNVGGATEISRYLVSQFEAAKRTGTGVDLFFGGGEYDHRRAHEQGLTVPPWPAGQEPRELLDMIPREIGGETWRTEAYIGTVVSTFGICYNRDRLRDLGVTSPPTQWVDLTDPVYFRQLGVADPTKSGSIAKAFEMIIHQQMHESAVEQGWENGVRVVQLIGANARYFTDSASKVPIDVATGDAAAGLAIDFYARFQARVAGHDRMAYVTPVGGSSVSCDPISLLRGAPNREVAVRFIEFVLSKQGQRLWNDQLGKRCSRVRKYALCRLPIRRDFYPPHTYPQLCSSDDLSDPAINPYELAKTFTYHPEWTAGHFGVHRDLIRAMCLDAGEELRAAWAAIIAGGGPQRQPEAMTVMQRLPVTWSSALEVSKSRDRIDYMREWTGFFRENYRAVHRLAVRGGSDIPVATWGVKNRDRNVAPTNLAKER